MPRLALVAALGAALFGGGCASAGTPRRHHHLLAPDDASSAPPAPLGPWVGFAKIREYQPAGEVAHSAHRLGNDAGALSRSPDANADLRGEQPVGAVLLEALSPEPEAPVETYFVMRKLATGANPAGGDWEYLVVQPDGSMSAEGRLELCERCHAEAGPTFVFSPG